MSVTSELNMSMTSLNMNTTSAENMNTTSGLLEFSQSYSVVHGYLSIIVCVWGTISNIANIIVLTRPKMTSPTNFLLTWLALVDLLKLISYLPFVIHFYVMRDYELPFPSTRSEVWIVYCLCFISLSVVCHNAALWLTVSLAVFRYVYVGFPFGGAKHCSLRRAKMAVVAIFVSTIIVCIPNYMTTTFEKVVDDANNATSLYYTVRTIKPSLEMFNYWIHALLFKILPCILLTLLTILLIVNMHKVKGRRNKLLQSHDQPIKTDHHQYATNRTTAMLLAVVVLSLLSELPHGVLALCNIFINNFYKDVYHVIGDLLDMMALLSSSVNFILYCSMSQLFKETFRETFCQFCEKITQKGHDRDVQGVKFEAIVTHSNGISVPFLTNNSY